MNSSLKPLFNKMRQIDSQFQKAMKPTKSKP